MTYASDSGLFGAVFGVRPMLDFTFREFALALAIVYIFCAWFIDRQVLHSIFESLSMGW